MAAVSLIDLCAVYSGKLIVDSVSLELARGEFLVLLGPSGCGKTTTLRMLAGFAQPSSGRILFDGKDVTALPPRARDIGMVFQNYALFPTMTAAENIGFPLRQRKAGRAEIDRRVDELVELVHLKGLADSYPAELSGGQQQRVALARALAFSPRLLLMDEPLGALDQKLRDSLQLELHRIQRDLGITTILVTHDQQEAMLLADRIVIMNGGRIQQTGTPIELYRRPANAFVADFIGKSNIVRGRLERAGSEMAVLRTPGGAFCVAAPAGLPDGTEAQLVLRPENVVVTPDPGQGPAAVTGVIEQTLFLGNTIQYVVRLPDGDLWHAQQPSSSDALPEGLTVAMTWDPARVPLLAESR
jgi:spermidine/putrescine transport system ATP-binding protein